MSRARGTSDLLGPRVKFGTMSLFILCVRLRGRLRVGFSRGSMVSDEFSICSGVVGSMGERLVWNVITRAW